MANGTYRHKNSKTSGAVPTSLEYGEIALNYLKGDEKLFIKNSNDEIVPCNFISDATKQILDNLTQTVIDNSHTHSNKSILDGITSALVSDWNNAVHKSGDEDISGHKQFTEGVDANAGLGVTGGANIDETNTGLLKLQDTDDNGTSYESEITDSEGVLEIKSQRYRFYDDTKTKYIDVLVDADGNYRINGNLYVLGGLTIEGNGIASVATQYSFAVNSNNELVLTIDD